MVTMTIALAVLCSPFVHAFEEELCFYVYHLFDGNVTALAGVSAPCSAP